MPKIIDESKRKQFNDWMVGNKINQGREPWNKGKHGVYSEETKIRMVESRKIKNGWKMPEGFSEKVRNRMKGKIVSDESKKRMSESAKKKVIPKEQREKMTSALIKSNKNRAGENNNFWKGGITDTALLIKASEKYLKWREDVYKRDNYTCQHCGKGSNLEAHHIKSYSLILNELKEVCENDLFNAAMSCEILWDISNGLTLCRDCHSKTDNYLVKAKKLLITSNS